MKNLKHIQLFEAFDSKILGKTLGYIKDKSSFLDLIKRLCSSIDYPLSKMSDDYFEYLPFKKALNKADMTGDETCDATSKEEFPQYAVEGAKCEGGKLKRMWGARTRDVVCPVCNGTGVKPKKSEVKLLKFWFTAEGKYVTTTLVDGLVTKTNSSGRKSAVSLNMSDYTVGDRVGSLRDLSGGEVVKVRINSENMVAYIWKEGSRYYAIQNNASGSTPGTNDWQRFGRYSWALGGGEYSNMFMLFPKDNGSKDVEEVDPYSWNSTIQWTYSGVRKSNSDIVEALKDAHFAIVLDFGKLKKSEYETKADMQSSREMAKKGSKLDPSQSDEEIRKRNIERYINTLSQNLDITKDISNCNKLVKRSIGSRQSAMYIIYATNIYSGLGYMIDDYLNLLKTEDNKYAENIKDRSDELFKKSMRMSSSINSTIKELKEKISSNIPEPKPYFDLLNAIEELNDVVYKTLTSFQIDSIEDFEILNQKISSMRNILKSDRYGMNRLFNYVVDYIINGYKDRAYSYITDSYYINIDKCLENIERVKVILSKL